jgi:hypothetical protein
MKARSPGYLTHLAIYAVALTALYIAGTREVTGSFDERQQRDFHIAAVSAATGPKGPTYVAYSLAQLRAGKLDPPPATFLLPQGDIRIDAAGDLHRVAVLERHPDWQLVEYRYGNSHNSTSRYRAYRDRVEPVSYRITMDMGLFFSALLLLVPTSLVAALINAAWKAIARRRQGPTAAG